MALESGTRLGSYEISDLLGKGGMGEVYRARDTKLGREVAIKVLPSEFAQDKERLARLEREARMLASLNHPNIAAIHGLEESEGTRFLVLELVEGNTLADQIKRGAIPVEESLKLALQIAEALEAAHEKGVIHRDLKPANIKVTPDGKVKVLDFGLAKAFIGDQADVNLSNSPTLSMQATQQGVVLGTAAYMSPEQAGGEAADSRTDVWSFGVVLFEMMTGRQLFSGKNVTHILADVVRAEPRWEDLPQTLNPRVRLLLEGCLEKEQKDRLSGISDARVSIQRVLADPEGLFVQPTPRAGEVTPQSRLPWVAAAVLTLSAIVATWYLRPLPSPELPVLSRWDYVLPEDRDFRGANRSTLAFSPDGRQFVYNGSGGLYLRSMDERESRLIPGTEAQLWSPTFSPDGQWLAFSQDNQLKKIPVVGGASVTLADFGGNPNPAGISWDVDDTIIFMSPGQGVMRVSADGGEPEVVIGPGEAAFGGFPQTLPGGRAILTNPGGGRGGAGTVGLYSIESGESQILFPGNRPRYVGTGHVLYTQGAVLFGIGFDVARGETVGGPVPLVEGVLPGPSKYAVSDTGSLVYVAGNATETSSPNGILTWVDLNGETEPLPLEPRPYRHPRLSPDGTRLAVQTTDSNGVSDIWIYDLDGNTQIRQLTGEGNNSRPVWTPDGQQLTFMSDRDGRNRVYIQNADLSGVAQPLTEGVDGGEQQPESWTPDGTTLSMTVTGSGQSVWTQSTDEGAEPELFVEGGSWGVQSGASAFSPDGNWIVYRNNGPIQPTESSGEQLFVQPYPPTGSEFQITQGGGSYPMWSRDGSRLLYRRGAVTSGFATGVGGSGLGLADEFIAVDISLDGTPIVTNETILPIQGFHVFFGFRDYDITADGERFIMVFPEGDAVEAASEPERPRINVVLNWFEELKERVPVP